jgi:FkbM family methyltransferase
MSKEVRLYGRRFVLSGGDGDDYYSHIRDGADLTDPVLHALRPVVGEDAVCVDAGANIGIHSLGMSHLAPQGHVYAFEPSPGAFDWLQRNLSQNGVTNVTAVQSALSDRVGTIGFHDVPFFTAGSFTAEEGSYLGSGAVGSNLVEVPCTTLDTFVEAHRVQRVDVVKIDVEGAELAVLDGAQRTLADHRPVVVMEFNSFGFSMHNDVLPHVALTRVQAIFPHVFVIDRLDGSLARLSTPAEAYQFLYLNGIHGPADNLLCAFTDRPAERNFRLTEAVRGSGSPDPTGAAAELEAMKRTVSWRVTAPLRAARTRLDREPSLRRVLQLVRRSS